MAKVLEVRSFFEVEPTDPKDIFVQWFAIESSDAYAGIYFLEALPSKKKSKKSRELHKQVLDLSEVTILAFGFQLTTRSLLRATTVKVVQDNLFSFDRSRDNMKQEESQVGEDDTSEVVMLEESFDTSSSSNSTSTL